MVLINYNDLTEKLQRFQVVFANNFWTKNFLTPKIGVMVNNHHAVQGFKNLHVSNNMLT